MEVVRYINNEKIKGKKLPEMEITNPAVIRIIQNMMARAKAEAG